MLLNSGLGAAYHPKGCDTAAYPANGSTIAAYPVNVSEELAHGMKLLLRHPREMGAAELTAFLSHLATQGKVAPATQAQALNAIVCDTSTGRSEPSRQSYTRDF